MIFQITILQEGEQELHVSPDAVQLDCYRRHFPDLRELARYECILQYPMT
jgi:hypothetical protein